MGYLKEGKSKLVVKWHLVAMISLCLFFTCLFIMYLTTDLVEGVRATVRFTARSSLTLFCLVFAAAPLRKIWSNTFTIWLKSQRRFLGLSFAISHLYHGLGLIAFAILAPADFSERTPLATYIFGVPGYTLIFLMALTSFQWSSKLIGPAKWKALHLTGIYVIWLVFFSGSLKRALTVSSTYWPVVALLVTLMILRWMTGRKDSHTVD